MTKRILRRSVASLGCLYALAICGCPPPGPPAAPAPTFTSGSGDTLGTVSDGMTSFDLKADNQGNLSRITSSAGGSFSLDPQGNLTNLTSADGTTLNVTQDGENMLTIALDDVELGSFVITLAAGDFPAVVTSRRRALTDSERPVVVPSFLAVVPDKDSPRSAVDDELDSQTFCRITNGCAIASCTLSCSSAISSI